MSQEIEQLSFEFDELDRERIERARNEVRAAGRALRSEGHSDGCACKLCIAVRSIKSALRILGEQVDEPR